jgi:hypothetical protein
VPTACRGDTFRCRIGPTEKKPGEAPTGPTETVLQCPPEQDLVRAVCIFFQWEM